MPSCDACACDNCNCNCSSSSDSREVRELKEQLKDVKKELASIRRINEQLLERLMEEGKE